jgi:drug/metabolite transporter (DMT)-like permease
VNRPASPLALDAQAMDSSAAPLPAADSKEASRLFARNGRLMLLLSAFFFGGMAVAARSLSGRMGAAQIAFVRFAIGFACVLAIRAWRPEAVRWTRPGLLFWRGLLGGAAVLLYFVAIGHLGAGLATNLNYTFPLWAAIFAAMTLGERLSAPVIAGMLVSTAGLFIAVGPSELDRLLTGLGDPQHRWGLAAGILSSLFGGAATTTIRALRRTDSAMAIFGAFCLFGGLLCLPFALSDWRPIDLELARGLLLVGLLSFCAQTLFTFSLGYVSTAAGAAMAQLTVVSSYVMSALLLGEVPPAHALLGGVVLMAGVLIASIKGASR